MHYYDKTSGTLQTTKFTGALIFPDIFLEIYYQLDKRAAGFVTITDDGVTVTSCKWNEEAYQNWCADNPESDVLLENKIARIKQSKTDLEVYLAANPMLWTDGNYYSITKEKQTQLTSKLAVAQAKSAMGVPYDLKWNTTDEVCVPWELSSLYSLAFAIDERVTALVSYQQAKEVAIRNASTQEELDAIVVDYATV